MVDVTLKAARSPFFRAVMPGLDPGIHQKKDIF
jgi:hypothetical protein